MREKNITILAIDTSCDDTCISIIKCKRNFEVLSNIISSQIETHRKYGGVYPTVAKREHQKKLPLVLEKALKKAKNSKIDLIAVTIGPGLEPCLWMGVNFAKDLAKKENLPIVPVNHIEAHILANFINQDFQFPMREDGSAPFFRFAPLSRNSASNFQKIFPAICLVVSGGHSQLILMKDFGVYKILGETRDDAAGECFDKTARILGLGYPGGPAIEGQASEFKVKNSKLKITLPRPMIYQKNYDFSFSGLKTAVLYDFKSRSLKTRMSKDYIREMAKKIQQAIIDVLIHKTIKATKAHNAKSVILGGGVAANTELRKQFKSKIKNRELKVNFLVPSKKLSTDNAAMVAVAGYYQWLRKGPTKTKNVEANADLRL
jgi:N6-L-threonylcarbamoyladenine synthase